MISISLIQVKTRIILFIVVLVLSVRCNEQARVVVKPDALILRFEMDSNGNITNEKVRAQVLELGKALQKSADKMMMSSYTEQSGSEEQNEKTAKKMAWAVRELMKTQGERNATNVGVDIKGFRNPVDSVNPANMINRRIEIIPM